MTTFRKATIAMFACACGAILFDTTPAHAAVVGTPHCGGDACAYVDSINTNTNTMVIFAYPTLSFSGHFQLQTPQHTSLNYPSTDRAFTSGQIAPFKVPFVTGQYCFTAWKYLGSPGQYQKIGGTCWNVTT
jgi:hypothetical protein